MYNIFNFNSPVKFLVLEGDVNASLFFVSDTKYKVFEAKIGEFPVLKPFSDITTTVFDSYKFIHEIKMTSFVYLDTWEFNIQAELKDEVTAKVLSNYDNNSFIKNNHEFCLERFYFYFDAHLLTTDVYREPELFELDSFLKWIDRNDVFDKKDLNEKFDYKNFW